MFTSKKRRAMLLATSGIALAAVLSACSSDAGSGSKPTANSSAAAAPLTNIVVATPNTGFSPQSINFEIADYLGYYKQQGLSVTFENLGTPQAVLGALSTGKADFAIMNDTSMVATAAQGQSIGGTAFYEFTYPFKYGVAVNPSSKVKKLSQLKGTTVGTDSFGQSEYNVGQIMLTKAGVPESQVHWLATGVGVTSGQALQKGQISALFYSDAGYGSILSAGIPLRFLSIPNGVPQVGGQMVVASTQVWAKQRPLATKMATAINESSAFILANPTAASYAYLKQFPTAAPPGNSLSDQIAAVSLPVQLRMKLYAPPAGHGLVPGEVYGQSLKDSLAFQGLPASTNVTKLYSNAVAAASNKFDLAQIKKDAKNYKIPGIKGAVKVPTVPAGTP